MSQAAKKANPRAFQHFYDVAHIVLCFGCAAMGILLIIDIDRFSFAFPVIFFLGAVLNILYAVSRFRKDRDRQSHRVSGTAFLLLGIILLGVTVVSAIGVFS